MTTQLAFHGHQFSIVTRKNQIWLTSKDLALALGYAKTNAITHVYNVNADEFTPGMTEVVESNTSGNLKARSRIFSLRGAHLIAMFARTPVAKEFRRWVLDILDREVGEPVTKPAPIAHPHPVRRTPIPKFRYLITLTYKDTVTGQEEIFRGGANSPDEIIQGTAKRFGMYITEMAVMPVNAYF